MASGDQGHTLAGNKENTKEDLHGILSWSTLDSLEKILSSVCELVLCRYDVLFPSKLSDTETVISNHAQIC